MKNKYNSSASCLLVHIINPEQLHESNAHGQRDNTINRGALRPRRPRHWFLGSLRVKGAEQHGVWNQPHAGAEGASDGDPHGHSGTPAGSTGLLLFVVWENVRFNNSVRVQPQQKRRP